MATPPLPQPKRSRPNRVPPQLPAAATLLPPRARAASPFEDLEKRRLCSVTVTQGWTGYFTIVGTSAADTVDVAVNRTTGTFTVDGVTYAGAQHLDVIGGDGNDTIRVSGTGSGSLAASISGGAGNDTISLNFDGAIWGGDGDDYVTLYDAFRGQVLGEGGGDNILIVGNCVDTTIDGGAGDDGIDASHNNYGVLADGGTGDDAIIGSPHDDQLHGGEGDDYIFGDGGNDTIYVQDSGGTDYVWGGAGYDTMYGNVSDIIMDSSVEVVYRS